MLISCPVSLTSSDRIKGVALSRICQSRAVHTVPGSVSPIYV